MDETTVTMVGAGAELGDGTTVDSHVVLGTPGRMASDVPARTGANCHLRAHGVLYAGATFGDNVRTGHHWMVREGTTIGNDSLVGSGVVIDDQCRIGSRVSIQTGVYIPTFTVIEDDVFLGPRVCLTNDKFMGRPAELVGVTVRRGARLGANCVVLPGIEIGEQAVVGSGAVVTKDVPAYSIVAGNPARVMGEVPADQRLDA